MADDFFTSRYQTQRVNQNIDDDLAKLDTPLPNGDEKVEDDIFAIPKDDAIVRKDDGLGELCTLEDLLNGYVRNQESLNAIDECLYHISREWDVSDILEKDVADCNNLLKQKCKKAQSQLLTSLYDDENAIYGHLLRLARKIKSLDLVIGNQKMVYIPHQPEELETILNKLKNQGLDSILSVKTNRRTGMKSVSSLDDDGSPPPVMIIDEKDNNNDDEIDDDDGTPEPEPVNNALNPLMAGNDQYSSSNFELQDLILSKRINYKNTSIARRIEKKHGGRSSIMNLTGISHKKKEVNQSKLEAIEDQIENNETTNLTNDIEMATNKEDVKSASSSNLRKAHSSNSDIICEGCGHHIDLVDCYDTAICYFVPILPKYVAYFHDSFCVTLRRLKESIRRFVMDESLPVARRASTSVGYVKNLLANYNTLITTRAEIDRPNPFLNDKKKNHNPILQMSYVRSHVHRLVLRQEAINGREAKNFADEYDWKFANIPQTIQFANLTIYGQSLAQYVVQQLLSKQLESLWLTLAFIISGMSATNALQLLDEHRTSLAKVKNMEDLDLVLISMIESSNFTIAMALYLSAWMSENAETDLSRADDFEEVAEKYIKIAAQLVASVESDHLLSLLLETPTDIAHLSVFEIAIKYDLFNFMDDSRIQMLMAHMWSEFDFLNPQKNFRTDDIGLYEMTKLLARSPARFYYCPVGRYWTESVMYVCYVMVVTGVVYERNYNLSSDLTGWEWVMWIFNCGFVLGEMTQMMFEGVAYLTDSGNMFDIIIMIDWGLLAMMRFGCKSAFSGSLQCNWESDGSDPTANLEQGDKNAILMYMFIFCWQICVLWSRCALIFTRARSIGPFISMIPGMVKDICYWAFVLSIFYVGFSFGTFFITSTDITGDGCGDVGELNSLPLMFEYNFILLMGQSDWELLNATDCMGPKRSLLLKVYMWGFSVIGTVLLLNLLIAMMASTYEQIREGTAKQVNFSRAEQTFQLSHRNAIIPPPLNVLAYAFAIVWFVFEFIIWLISLGGYIMNVGKLVPVFIDYDDEFPDYKNQNERSIKKTKLICCGLFQKLKNPQELLKVKLAKNYSSTARYCQFCRCYMRIPGNISHYFQLFVNYRLDEADVKFITSLMHSAGICPQCYRPYRKYDGDNETNRLYRWQVILEILSFYVFMLIIYLPLLILIAIPSLFSGGLDYVDDVIGQTKRIKGGPMLIKDDKYVQLVENIIEDKSNSDNAVISTQINALNKKLVQVKQGQSSTRETLAEQSIYLEEQSKILHGLIPYIKNIDIKMDQSMSSSKLLHKKQIDIFHAEMKEQSVKIDASRNVLDEHSDYNKLHREQLEESQVIAKQHQNEMEFFKQELERLRDLRQKDELLKREQEQRQIELEEQNVKNIQSFNKELKQQRVLREVEIAKQSKLNEKNKEQVKAEHGKHLKDLKKQIERQQFLRSIEDKKHSEEKEKREILQLKQQQDMQILTAQMKQIKLVQEAEEQQREIELKLTRAHEKKMTGIQSEILALRKEAKTKSLSRAKSGRRKQDSLVLQKNARIEHLQSKLIVMKAERQKNEIIHKEKYELNELKHVSQDNALEKLQNKMQQLAKKQNDIVSIAQREDMKNEKEQIQHQINLQKLENSMASLGTNSNLMENVLAEMDKNNDGVLTAKEFAEAVNITQQEAEDIISKYDQDGDGKLDQKEFEVLRAKVLGNKEKEKAEKESELKNDDNNDDNNDDDGDGDGTDSIEIDLPDLFKKLKQITLSDIDDDGNYSLDEKEFKAYFKKHYKIPHHISKQIFDGVDINSDGKISVLEFMKWKEQIRTLQGLKNFLGWNITQ